MKIIICETPNKIFLNVLDICNTLTHPCDIVSDEDLWYKLELKFGNLRSVQKICQSQFDSESVFKLNIIDK